MTLKDVLAEPGVQACVAMLMRCVIAYEVTNSMEVTGEMSRKRLLKEQLWIKELVVQMHDENKLRPDLVYRAALVRCVDILDGKVKV